MPNTEPIDPQLARLLEPEGRSMSVRIDDTAERLIAHPRGMPLWFMALCVIVPLAVFAGYVIVRAIQEEVAQFEVAGLVFGCFAAPLIIGAWLLIDHEQLKKGDFFVLDKAQRTLTLPRIGAKFQHEQIQALVEVHAWHTVRDDEGTSSDWLAEASVLVRTKDDKPARHSVIACSDTGMVSKVAQSLAEHFGVDRQVLKLDRATRRRLKAE